MAVPISKDFLYTEILGIPRHECPPSHYRLLGLNNFERDPATIQAAIAERVRLIQQAQLPPQADALIRHVQEVGNLLLTPHLKEAYDGILLKQTMQQAPSAPPPPPGNHPPRSAYPPPGYAGHPPAYPSQPHVGRTGPAPTAPATGSSAPRATAQPKRTKPRPKLKRSRVYVPVWARVVIIGMFIAAHGAIYWYAYDYLNRPQQIARPETIEPQQSAPENVARASSQGSSAKRNVPGTSPPQKIEPSASTKNPPADPPVRFQGKPPESKTTTNQTGVSPSAPQPRKSDLFGATAPPAMELPVPTKPQPFSQLEPFVGLPEFKPQTSTREGAVTLGTLVGNIATELELAIESSAANLAGRRFDLVTNPTSDVDGRTWDVKLVAPSDTDLSQSKSIGHLHADQTGSLKFHWNASAQREVAAQLQNTMLLCSHADHQHTMALRVPENLPAIGIDLGAKDLTTTVSLTAPPAAETLCVSVNFDKELSVPIVAEPADRTAPIGDSVLLTLGATDDEIRGEMRVVTKQNGDDQIQLSVLPKYRQKDEGKLAELSQESLVSQISRLQRLLSRDAEDLAAAYSNLPTHLANMKTLQATVPRDKDQAGAKARTLLQLEGYIKKCQSTIRAKTRTMPASYEALHRIIEAARLGRTLNNKTALQYRLFAQTPSGPLLLVQGTEPVTREKSTDDFSFLDNTPGPAGTWVKLKPEMQIVTLSEGGSIRATDASGKRSVGSGTWRKTGDLIHISLSGSTGDFKFYNGVALATEDGTALFRKF